MHSEFVHVYLYICIYMISGSKGQKAVRACTIRLLNLGPAKHEEAAIYAVNHRITNVLELRELFYIGAIRGYQMRGKIPFDPHIIYICVFIYVLICVYLYMYICIYIWCF